MLSPDDIDAQELKLNKYNLEILDSRLERKYNFSRKKKSVKFSRVYFLLLTLTFSIYVVIDLIVNTLGVYGYIKIGLLIICISIFFGMFLELYTVFYYKFMVYGIIIGVFLKIMFDWLNLDHNISISGALLALISTNSMNLNIKIIYIIVLNSIHNLHYFIRVIFLYYGNDTDYIYLYLNDVDIDVKKFNITISLILLVTAIILISLILNYKVNRKYFNFKF